MIYWCLGILIGGVSIGIGSAAMISSIAGPDAVCSGRSVLIIGAVIAIVFMAGACTERDRHSDHDH